MDAYFTNVLKPYKVHIIAIWSLVFVVAVIFGPSLLNVTNDVVRRRSNNVWAYYFLTHHFVIFSPGQFFSPAGTPGHVAREQLTTLFPDQVDQFNLIVLIRAAACAGNLSLVLAHAYTRDLSLALNASLSSYSAVGNHLRILSLGGYFLTPAVLPEVAASFVSADQTATFVAINYHYDPTVLSTAVSDLLALVQSSVDSFPGQPVCFTVGLTGLDVLWQDLQTGVETDLVTMDSIALPLAFGILAWNLQSWRLMLLPLLAVVVSLLCAYAIMYPFALYVSALAPVVFTMPSCEFLSVHLCFFVVVLYVFV
jgi:hypothetical protein